MEIRSVNNVKHALYSVIMTGGWRGRVEKMQLP